MSAKGKSGASALLWRFKVILRVTIRWKQAKCPFEAVACVLTPAVLIQGDTKIIPTFRCFFVNCNGLAEFFFRKHRILA